MSAASDQKTNSNITEEVTIVKDVTPAQEPLLDTTNNNAVEETAAAPAQEQKTPPVISEEKPNNIETPSTDVAAASAGATETTGVTLSVGATETTTLTSSAVVTETTGVTSSAVVTATAPIQDPNPTPTTFTVLGAAKFVGNTVLDLSASMAKDLGAMAGKFGALTGFLYFNGTVGARLFAKSTVVRPVVLTLVGAALPQTIMATELLTVLTSAEMLGNLYTFAEVAAGMFDKGIIGDFYKPSKDKAKDTTKQLLETQLGYKFKKEGPEGWAPVPVLKHALANAVIDASGLVGGFAGATYGVFFTQTVTATAIGTIRNAPMVGPIAAFTAAVGAVASNVAFFALGAVGTAFVVVSTKEVYDYVGGMGSNAGRGLATAAIDATSTVANATVDATYAAANSNAAAAVANAASAVASATANAASTVANKTSNAAHATSGVVVDIASAAANRAKFVNNKLWSYANYNSNNTTSSSNTAPQNTNEGASAGLGKGDSQPTIQKTASQSLSI